MQGKMIWVQDSKKFEINVFEIGKGMVKKYIWHNWSTRLEFILFLQVSTSIKFAGSTINNTSGWREKNCDSEVSCLRTQHNVSSRVQTQATWSGDDHTIHEATVPP